jgi:hypothetical protein
VAHAEVTPTTASYYAGQYSETVTTTRIGSAKQVILLFALALCVVAMHHVGMPDSPMGGTSAPATQAMSASQIEPGPAPASGDEHPGMPGDEHGLLHLCQAVLSAAGAVLLALLALGSLSRPAAPPATSAGLPGSAVPERPPDRRGRTVLTSLCVLRV